MARLAALPALGLAAALVAGAGAACSRADRACTEIGCTSGVSVEAAGALAAHPDAAVVEVCVRARCQSYRAAEVAGSVFHEDDRLGDLAPSEVVVTLLDGRGVLVVRGKVTAAPSRQQPNGEGCPPVCGQAAVTMAADGSLVTRSPG